MLPTKGYFQDIDCPYYDTSCGRPYCHFRHKKKQQETGNSFHEDSEIPTYKPTPKNQLVNNRAHIPISYVPDLAFRPERTVRNIQKLTHQKPTYKPTPLSVLSSASKQESVSTSSAKDADSTSVSEADSSDRKSAASHSEYCPTFNKDISTNYMPSNLDKPLENECHEEYKPAGEITNYEYKPSSNIDGSDNEPIENESEHEYKPAGDTSQFEYKPSSNIDGADNQSDMHYLPSGDCDKIYIPIPQTETKYATSTIDFEDLDIEFDMIDEIINTSSEQEAIDRGKLQRNTQQKNPSDSKTKNTSDIEMKNKDKLDKDCSTLKEHDRKHSNKHDTKKLKSSDNHHSRTKSERSKSDTKHSKSENKIEKSELSACIIKHSNKNTLKTGNKEKSSEKTDKSICKTASKHSDSKKNEKNTLKTGYKEKSSEKSIYKAISKHSDSEQSDKTALKTGYREKSSEKADQSVYRAISKDSDSEQDPKTKRSGSSRSSSIHKSKHKSQEKYKERSKEKKLSGKESEKSRHHSSSSFKEKTSPKEHKNKRPNKDENRRKKQKLDSYASEISRVKEESCSDPEDSLLNIDSFDIQIDSEDDETMQECYRIFNEYKPPITEVKASSEETVQEKPDLDVAFGKKRIAHINAEKITTGKYNPPPAKLMLNAAQVMANRFKEIRAVQASDEQNNIMEEVKNISLKRSAHPALATVVKNYKIQKTLKCAQLQKTPSKSSLVDDIIGGTNKTNTAIAKFNQRKIAPVSNVYSMQQAKQRIEEMKQKTAETNARTTAQTTMGTKRVAHIPEFSLANIPDVLQADKSKLPVNVRTRFLTMIADECGKLYLTKEDAYTRALNEEFACYEKCKVLITYKNSAMLAVSRIRREHQERVKQGLAPLYGLEDSSKDKSSEFKGKNFYENVKRYLLTEEELDIHGYPKESKMPGRATISNRKEANSISLEEHQRKCSRCSKIYIVDEDGFAFYDEECLYHPLKKRTLRGEATYLCCRSNDDTGCSTSHTHVSECRDNSELEGFQTTMRPGSDCDDRSTAVYALDCEMCYTTKGLELTRVTIVDNECKTVYDTLVKPLNPIIDYNTRFSGITKEQMDRTSTSILQVQANVLHLCNSKTILVGHSLESDMKALKIIHKNIIDTAILFPHRIGLPHKRALRALASEYLKKIIQNDISGHDSAEDSITCMELIKWKLKEDLKVRGIKS